MPSSEIAKLQSEIAELKAENERLKWQIKSMNAVLEHQAERAARLSEQVWKANRAAADRDVAAAREHSRIMVVQGKRGIV